MGIRWPVSLISSASRLLQIWEPLPNNSPPLRSRLLALLSEAGLSVLVLWKEITNETPSGLLNMFLGVSMVSSSAGFLGLCCSAANDIKERLPTTRRAHEYRFHFFHSLDGQCRQMLPLLWTTFQAQRRRPRGAPNCNGDG